MSAHSRCRIMLRSASGRRRTALIYEVGNRTIDPSDRDRGLDSGNAVVQGFNQAISQFIGQGHRLPVDGPAGSVTGSEIDPAYGPPREAAGKKIVVSMVRSPPRAALDLCQRPSKRSLPSRRR